MAGSGEYQICLQTDLIGALATIDIDPSRAQYHTVAPSDHDQDGSPIFQGHDYVVWEFDHVTDTLATMLRDLERFDVFIKTRLPDHYTFDNKKCIFDSFTTRSEKSRRVLTGRAVFVNVEDV